MWFKKEEPMTVEKAIEFLKNNSEKITNEIAESLLVVIIKSPANKVLHFRVEE